VLFGSGLFGTTGLATLTPATTGRLAGTCSRPAGGRTTTPSRRQNTRIFVDGTPVPEPATLTLFAAGVSRCSASPRRLA